MRPTLIRTTGSFPPGGFQFVDPVTGKSYLEPNATFDTRVKQIIADRFANKRLFVDMRFVDYEYVAKQLSEQNCQRLKGNPLFCDDGIPKASHVSFTPQDYVRTCPRCGSKDFTEEICPTCSGRKVLSRTCSKCAMVIR